MNAHELEIQQLKMAWLAAKEAGDIQAQLALLHDYPDAQAALIDFIAAYHATDVPGPDSLHTPLSPMTQHAYQTALERVFGTPVASAANLRELRMQHGLSMANAARGLRLGIDVWKKFEDGAIELVSLSERQLERLATFFRVSSEQFGSMLNNSQPTLALNRRQTSSAARSQQQGPQKKQSFAEAIAKSTLTKEEKRLWLE
jgi:transcriptional regulator with XRE-family HTH domain